MRSYKYHFSSMSRGFSIKMKTLLTRPLPSEIIIWTPDACSLTLQRSQWKYLQFYLKSSGYTMLCGELDLEVIVISESWFLSGWLVQNFKLGIKWNSKAYKTSLSRHDCYFLLAWNTF